MKHEPEYYRDPEAEAKELREELAEKALALSDMELLDFLNNAEGLSIFRCWLNSATFRNGEINSVGNDSDILLGKEVRKLFEDYYTPIVISEMQRRKT